MRLRYSENTSNDTNDYSDILTFVIGFCSPQLTSFSPLDTQCSYTSDGGFTANFDRALNLGEELRMSLFEVDSAGNEALIDQTAPGEVTALGPGNTYAWPLPLPSGNYLVKYQTNNGGIFSSLETSGQFTIASPLPVIFNASKLNDVFCNGGSDGAIDLSASGGVGSFSYELNNSGNWIPFSNSGSHTISNLPRGTKTIRVQDANQCTERN